MNLPHGIPAALAVLLIVGALSTGVVEAGAPEDCKLEFDGSAVRLVCDDARSPTPVPSPISSPLPAAGPDHVSPASDHQPNIILFLTDDQRFDTLHLMPRVQQLQGQGMTFTNAFVTTPLCCPARASILTGQYTHNHDIWTNGGDFGGMAHFDDSATLATSLQAAGYATALIGKYMNGYRHLIEEPEPPGWDFWVAQNRANQYNYKLNVNGSIEEYGQDPEDYSPTVLTSYAVDFLASVEEPFFLLFSITVPHFPFEPPPDSTCEWTNDFEKADCALEAANSALSDIVSALGDRHDETMIIYTSDNGFIRNEHGRESGKNCPYDECLRVPLVISYPAVAAAGSINSSSVLNIDLAPTILAIAGGDLPNINGKSLVPLLSDERPRVRRDFLFELGFVLEGSSELQVTDGVRNQRWKLIVNSDGREELYNVRRDPAELNNVINRPRHQDLRQDLLARLQVLRQE